MLGLGNPGDRYRSTRHNVGFLVVDRLAARAGVTLCRDDAGVLSSAIAVLASRDVVLAKPETFMNRSGDAVAAVRARFEAPDGDLVVVVDDADLPLGRIRIRARGGSGGHNGLESIATALGTEQFVRVRVGVAAPGRPRTDLAAFVLSEFARDEEGRVEDAVECAADVVEGVLLEGLDRAMNRWNGQVGSPSADRPDGELSTQS